MKISYNQLQAKGAIELLDKISGQVLPGETTYKLNKIRRAVLNVQREVMEAIKPYLKRDEAGQPMYSKLDSGAEGVEVDDAKREEFEKMWDELMKKEVEFKPLSPHDLKHMSIPLQYMDVLEDFICEVEVVR